MNYYKIEYLCNDEVVVRKAQVSSDKSLIKFKLKPDLEYQVQIVGNNVISTKTGSINAKVIHEIGKVQIVEYVVMLNSNEFSGQSEIITKNIVLKKDLIELQFETNGVLYKEVFKIKGAI